MHHDRTQCWDRCSGPGLVDVVLHSIRSPARGWKAFELGQDPAYPQRLAVILEVLCCLE